MDIRPSSDNTHRPFFVIGILLVSAFFLPAYAETGDLAGEVLAGDGFLEDADVELLTARRSVLAAIRTDGAGRFRFSGVPDGVYLLRVSAAGFTEIWVEVKVPAGAPLRIAMSVAPVRQEVTVTADPGRVQDPGSASQSINTISKEELALRARSVVAQVADQEEGASLQRTSASIGGIYIRGLTGNKVNVFVDGVRFSNGAQRGGINTFLNLNDPAQIETVELLRGPNSSLYGSDALGGSVQLLSVSPRISADRPYWYGHFGLTGNTADLGSGAFTQLAWAGRKLGVITSLQGRRINDLLAGGGDDSHSSFRRFFGIPADRFVDERQPDTGFSQYGGAIKIIWVPDADTQLTVSYNRNQQDGGKRSDQLLGGDGNLIADLRHLMLDFLYLRFDRTRLGWLDSLSLAYSYSAEREERVNQGGNGNPAAPINHEPERTAVHGISGQFGKRIRNNELFAGADYYQEGIAAPSFGLDPLTGVASIRRGRVPDGAQYKSGGFFLQDSFSLAKGRLRLNGSLRYSAASYRARASDAPILGGKPLWPDDSMRVFDWTWRAGVAVTPVDSLTLFANVSRGFRAPHVTDLGTLGLTGSGFEVAAPDLAGLGATVGSTAGAGAVSTGRPVVQLRPETALTFESGVRFQYERLRADFTFFVNDIDRNITKQSLILPAGAVGTVLGGEPIIAQTATGVVFVAVSPNPVLVQANYDDARLWGFEHRGDWRISSRWSMGTVFTYIHAEDRRTGLPPNIEGGTPAPDGWLRLRYTARNARWWVEPYLHFADRQDRLSSLDLDDRRTASPRSRSSIGNFFRNGAAARGFVGPGLDGVPGTPDDTLNYSGETLAQIQDRVLGVGIDSAPMYRAVAGYMTLNLRGGVRLGERHSLLAAVENLADKNYRGISWGVDAPGRSLSIQYRFDF